MKFFILAAFVAVAAAGTVRYGPVEVESDRATIQSQSDIRNLDGSSSFSFDSSDSVHREEVQSQKHVGHGAGTVNQGATHWTSPDGQQFSMSWVADENGFRPMGDHLPTPPPVPAEIAAMLPSLPKLSFEQLYGGAVHTAPSMTSYSAPKYETPRAETPKYETPRVETHRYEAPRIETPKYVAPRIETPKYVAPRMESTNYVAPRIETPKYQAPMYHRPAPVAPKYHPAPAY